MRKHFIIHFFKVSKINIIISALTINKHSIYAT